MFKNFMNFRALLVACFVLMPFASFAQVTISGTVRETSGEPIIGATVIEKGTQNGAATDLNGKFSFKVSSDKATIVVSYVGFETQNVSLAGRKNVVVTLKTDDELLDDVVVVGYGTMKKKLVTGATVQVKGEEVAKLNTTNALTAMQATTPGVQITQSSSQPGKGFKVNIRGAGTIYESSPLLVIDGIVSGTADNGLNGINPNDIESIDILKDAASAAIYGARAANGVILVTTKQGKAGAISLQYDGFVGVSNPYKRPATLNAQDYMQIVNEARYNTDGYAADWGSLVPKYILDKVNDGWQGTDWFDLYRNKNAVQHSHAMTLAGGSDRSKFSMSLNYSYNEGIMGGDNASDYKRYGGRINSEHVLYRNSKGRDIITIGENVSYWYHSSHDLAESNGYWNILKPTYTTSPLVPVYTENGELASPSNTPGFISTMFSNPWAGFSNGEYQALNRNKDFGVGATVFWTIEPIKGLKYRGQLNTGYSASNFKSTTLPFSESATNSSDSYSLNMNMYESSSMTMDNTLAYQLPMLGKHSIDLMIGQSFEQSNWGFNMGGSASVGSANVNSLIASGWEYTFLSNYDFANVTGATGVTSPRQGTIASFFGRANWNYDEKYMATVTVRRDGSNNFARGHRWGTFPSASAGWVISSEPFMNATKSWLDSFKIRASWGQNGNCNIPNFSYLSNVNFSPSNYADYGYKFDSSMAGTIAQNSYVTGAYLNNAANEDVTWETSEQINVGFDAQFFNGRLGLNFDWYRKDTRDWLVQSPLVSVLGYENPYYMNGGDIRNQGVEVALSWRDRIGKNFNYHANVNFAYNKNEVTRIAGDQILGIDVTDALFENSSYVALVQKGMPVSYFSGLSHSGIWQNQAQIDAARAAGQTVMPGAQPGDCIWDDYNGDGVIDLPSDRHMIGDPTPDFTLGVNLGFEWKGLDFAVQGFGAFGHQIMQSYRTDLLANGYGNYTKDIFNRWHGEGTSNSMPRLTIGGSNWSNVSDVYMQNGDFFKIQNVTIGYDFARLLKKGSPFAQLRLYAQAQNLYTFTGYTGVDPELCSNGGNGASWVRGVDVGLYPSARTYLVGLSVKFADSKAKPAKEAAAPVFIEKEVVKEVPVVKEVVKEVVKNGNPNTYVVTFPVNSSEIINKAEVDGIEKGSTVEIVAYASPEGNADANVALSQRRADAVAEYLKSRGVNVVRITAKGADTEHANRIAIITVK